MNRPPFNCPQIHCQTSESDLETGYAMIFKDKSIRGSETPNPSRKRHCLFTSFATIHLPFIDTTPILQHYAVVATVAGSSIFSTRQAVPYAQTCENVLTCLTLAHPTPHHQLITHLTLIKPQRNDRIPTPLQTLTHHPLHCVIPTRIHQIREIPNLTPNR